MRRRGVVAQQHVLDGVATEDTGLRHEEAADLLVAQVDVAARRFVQLELVHEAGIGAGLATPRLHQGQGLLERKPPCLHKVRRNNLEKRKGAKSSNVGQQEDKAGS